MFIPFSFGLLAPLLSDRPQENNRPLPHPLFELRDSQEVHAQLALEHEILEMSNVIGWSWRGGGG